VRAALARLGIERLVLSIHQVSFPGGERDLGYGTPYAPRAFEFTELVAKLGFTGIALGPCGVTSRIDPSPYDGAVFARNPLHFALEPFDIELNPGELVRDGSRARYEHAWDIKRRVLAEVAERRIRSEGAKLASRLEEVRRKWRWLEADRRFESIARAVGHDDWTRWPDSAPCDDSAGLSFEVEQIILADQHELFRAKMRELRLCLYGDVPIGVSFRDRFSYRPIFLDGYSMGAPPSRTNPEGQPWGYPVLDPDQLGPGGAGRAFLELRVEKLLDEHDGLRIDHPHGWVCPWVYRTDDPDGLRAVQQGARLFESPDLPDHPRLTRYARVRPDQIERTLPRYADGWVRSLEPEQLDRYAASIDLLADWVRARGADPADLMVEVLSTCPLPLLEVLKRHRLGRFRVTQKARPQDPGDVYRGDNAEPEDWIMTGNHDTPPLARAVKGWIGTPEWERRASHLAARLSVSAEAIARDPASMGQAMLAELFLGPAKNVVLFWVDLFGFEEIYNRPGEIHPDNWTLRVPRDFEQAYAARVESGEAPHLGRAIAAALSARGLDRDSEGIALVEKLGQISPR
jgi:4-alpha-glucanotransferase